MELNAGTRSLKETSKRMKTPRFAYLEEVERIKNEYGDLEQMRLRLGLSQRRTCQLLLVDPSAWTRWLKTDAPPHVYQALKWVLELKKMNPDAAIPSEIATRVDLVQSATESKLEQLENNIAILERSIALGLQQALAVKKEGRPSRKRPAKKKARKLKVRSKRKAATRTRPIRKAKKKPAKSKLKTKTKKKQKRQRKK